MSILIPRAAGDELELREELLAAVAAIRPVLAAAAPRNEAARTLVPEAVDAIAGAGLLRMKVPTVVGGLEASTATQMIVLAELAAIDAAAGWGAMVTSNSTAWMAAYLEDAALEEVFAGGRIPLCAGFAPPEGSAREVDGGLVVSGRYRFCSGIHHAEWLRFSTFVDGDPRRKVFAVVPQREVTIHDNWHTIGLRGTGSSDFSLQEQFIPARHLVVGPQRRRGGPLYRMTDLRWSSFEHAGIAFGLGRRALAELGALLRGRGPEAAPRESVLSSLGRLTLELDAAWTHALAVYDRELAQLADETTEPGVIGWEGRVVAAHATEIAVRCAAFAFRAAGGAALYQPNPFEQLRRDLEAASAHVVVTDAAYADYGTEILETPGDDR